MASIPCSLNFTSPFFNFSKSNRSQFPSCLSVSCFGTSPVKSLLGSSSSELFQHGFALKAGIFSGFSSHSPLDFGFFATAATGKTIYDFTVKVSTRAPPGIRCYHSPASTSSATTLTNILNSGVIACLRAQSVDVALQAAHAAITAGISVLEIVVSTPGVFQVLHQLVQDFPTTTLGVGTVLNTKDAENAKNAGAKFIMSPAIVKGILDQDSDDLLYIPGVMTPTEILSSYDAGAKIVKVYPVSAIGGVQYIATLKKPFPHIPMVASQGITIDSVGAYIDGGASAVVLSDAIFDKKAISQRNFTAIYHLAQLAALQGNAAVKRKEKIYPG